MKALKRIILCLLAWSIASCSSDSDGNNTEDNSMTLQKRIIYQTQTLYPESNSKEIQYYLNNEIVADTVFNNLNEWTHRKVIIQNGLTKTYQTLDTNSQVTANRTENYDEQGRVLGRRSYLPENLIAISYSYNSDNTITANAINLLDSSINIIAIYHKNSDGLIYKEFRQPTAFQPNVVESTILFDGSKPISMSNSVTPTLISFNYYTNPMPTNITKSVDELNNEVLLGLTLTRLAEEGNFYSKRNDSSNNGVNTTYQTDFNANNYIDYYKSTYVNTSTTNNLLTTEVFYYYN